MRGCALMLYLVLLFLCVLHVFSPRGAFRRLTIEGRSEFLHPRAIFHSKNGVCSLTAAGCCACSCFFWAERTGFRAGALSSAQ